MEARAHDRESYAVLVRVSRMNQGFVECSKHLLLDPQVLTLLEIDHTNTELVEKDCYVGILGDDFAGLRCTEILIEHGVRVTILESRDRIGGRVYQTDLLGYELAKRALIDAEIHTGTKVVRIRGTNCSGPRIPVDTEDDRIYRFGDMVVTVPLGLLKRQYPSFSPPLPPQLCRAIDTTSYSSLEKVFITFPSAFWEGTSDQDPDDEYSLPSFVLICAFPLPQLSKEDPESWDIELITFSTKSLAYITSSTATPNRASRESNVINNFFRPYYSLLPNYDTSNPTCQPSAALATNWQNDELAGYGSYMNSQIRDLPKEGEAEVNLEDGIRTLRHGMPDRGIWIAGDHTAPFVALGTLTGAYWSGVPVAVRILRQESEELATSGHPPIQTNEG
ncbi:hypothetical protein BBP40_002568 [Aspergillus hancockii]|nr:hypothetical protein BBP40_002568 [Aspergillus hancockii]